MDERIRVTDLELSLVRSDGGDLRPAVHAATADVSDAAFQLLLQQLFPTDIPVPWATVAVLGGSWAPGGATLRLRVKTPLLSQDVALRATLGATRDGLLHVTVAEALAGILPVTRFLEPVVERLAQQPGVRKAGPLAIMVDVPAVLQAHGVPIAWEADLVEATTSEGLLRLRFAPR